MKVVSYYSLLGTILSAIVSLTVETDANAWKLKRKMELILIVLTAIFGGVIRPNIQVWFTHMKGPFYVPLFKPFGIAFATTFGVCFFPNSLHYGSVIGATVLGMGIIQYYMENSEEMKRIKAVTKARILWTRRSLFCEKNASVNKSFKRPSRLSVINVILSLSLVANILLQLVSLCVLCTPIN